MCVKFQEKLAAEHPDRFTLNFTVDSPGEEKRGGEMRLLTGWGLGLRALYIYVYIYIMGILL